MPAKSSNFSRPDTGGWEAILSRRQDDEKAGEVAAGLSRFRDRRFNGYLRVKLPHDLDTEVRPVVTAYMNGSVPVRQKMINSMDGRTAGVLSAYGQRMASVAVRARSVEALRLGLVAVGLAEGRLDDPRDNLFVLAAVNDSASLIGTSLRELIADMEGFLPSAGLAGLQEFDQRKDRDKSIQAMGIRRMGTDQDFLYS
ncbi:hypothetical protein [Streptomyces sp. NPDC058256]|uniref:hypothetical protein n=1 Tax=Streptomyces sp. NPDC058256 TaxID=3346408 RepID=UPI0036E2F4BA